MLGLSLSSKIDSPKEPYNASSCIVFNATDVAYCSAITSFKDIPPPHASANSSLIRGNIFANNFTMFTWVKFASGDYAKPIITWTESNNVGMQLYIDASENLVFRMDTTEATGSTTLSTGTWYHIVVTYNDTTNTMKVYLNGSEELSNTSLDYDGEASGDSGYFYLGYNGNLADDGSRYLNGRIFEWGTYAQALSAADATAAYNGGDPMDMRHLAVSGSLGLVNWYTFGDKPTDEAVKAYDFSRQLDSYMLGANAMVLNNTTYASDAPSS